jgi:hypothetical protein
MPKKAHETTKAGPGSLTKDAESSEDHEAIERLAYWYWEQRGCPIGSPEEDWYRAENELRRPSTATAASA